MSGLEELYQEIILEHNKRPRNFGPLVDATHHANGNNPLCGDELSVSVKTENGRISAIQFEGQGCAISKASASLMSESLDGLKIEEGQDRAAKVLRALKGEAEDLVLETDGDLAALSGVKKFPARIKCATLAWHAFLTALEGGASASSELTD